MRVPYSSFPFSFLFLTLPPAVRRLKEYLHSIEKVDGNLMASVVKELSLDQEELDYVVDRRAQHDLAQSRDPIEFYFSLVNQIPK